MQASLNRMIRGEQPASDTVAQVLDTLFRSGPFDENGNRSAVANY